MPPDTDADRPSPHAVASDAYGNAFADVYDDWYRGVTDAEATASFVARRVANGPVLELGVGTGRLALPLAARGLTVIGIDASAPMLDRCRQALGRRATNDGGEGGVHLVQADMSRLPVRGGVTAALIAFNTLFNLSTAAAQQQLFHDLTRALDDRGLVIVEALDLGVLSASEPGALAVGLRHVDDGGGATIIGTSVDVASQTIRGQHTEIADGEIVVRPWLLRWATPAQIDEFADRAGFDLVERHLDWHGGDFVEGADRHLSVYRRRPPAS